MRWKNRRLQCLFIVFLLLCDSLITYSINQNRFHLKKVGSQGKNLIFSSFWRKGLFCPSATSSRWVLKAMLPGRKNIERCFSSKIQELPEMLHKSAQNSFSQIFDNSEKLYEKNAKFFCTLEYV